MNLTLIVQKRFKSGQKMHVGIGSLLYTLCEQHRYCILSAKLNDDARVKKLTNNKSMWSMKFQHKSPQNDVKAVMSCEKAMSIYASVTVLYFVIGLLYTSNFIDTDTFQRQKSADSETLALLYLTVAIVRLLLFYKVNCHWVIALFHIIKYCKVLNHSTAN